MSDNTFQDNTFSVSDYNNVQMIKAVKSIFLTSFILCLVILLVGGSIANYFVGYVGIKSILFACVAFLVLTFITLFVMFISVKNPRFMMPMVMMAFIIKIFFVMCYLFLVRNFFDVHSHIFSITLIFSMIMVAFTETYFLLKAKFRYQ